MHERIKLFFSHCGLNSVIEAAKSGVPMLCLPLFGDQFYNAEALYQHGAAEILDKDNISGDILRRTLEWALEPR